MNRRSLLLSGLVAGAAGILGVKAVAPVAVAPVVAEAYDDGDGWDGEDWVEDEYADDYTDVPRAPVSMDGAFTTTTSSACYIPLLWSEEVISARRQGLEGAGFAINAWGKLEAGHMVSLPKDSKLIWLGVPDDSA